jgi:hypothetical protein
MAIILVAVSKLLREKGFSLGFSAISAATATCSLRWGYHCPGSDRVIIINNPV